MNTFASPLYVKTSQGRRNSPGWAAFGLKQQQGQDLQAQVSEDPFPPVSRTAASLNPSGKLPANNVFLARSFSSVVLPSVDYHNKLTRVGGGSNSVVEEEGSHGFVFRKLKEIHGWAANSLIEDVMATVDNDLDKASSLLKEMVSAGRSEEYEETRRNFSSDDLQHDNGTDKGVSLGKITDLAADIAELSSTLEDALKDNHKELRDARNSYEHMLSGETAANMKQILGHLRSVPVEPEWDEDDVYLIHRKDSLRMTRLASQHSRAATNAFIRGDHFSAKQHSLKAQEEWLAAETLNDKAAKEILTIRNNKNDPWILDLHGLHVSEAVEALQEHLQKIETQVPMIRPVSPNRIKAKAGIAHSSSLDSSGQATIRQRPTSLQVVTGVGKHSRGQAALPTTVRNFLIDNGYRFDEARPGVITVRPKFRRR